MKISSISYAIRRFKTLQDDLGDLTRELGLPPLLCFVRQKRTHADVDNGWAFFEISLKAWEDDVAFCGKMREVRPDGKEKVVEIIIDPETIASIELEVYDDPEVDS